MTVLEKIQHAQSEGKLSTGAVENLQIWLNESRYADYRDAIEAHVAEGKWQELDDAFWTVIPFGTGGRRGRMYPFGSNAINDRTIGESAQGLANYLATIESPGAKRCAIAYDTRHRSRHFAELCASIMVANGFEVCFLNDYRSTPELSFLVRHRDCCCGIMVTASHNPPSDNAVKIYGAHGGQLIPPHDKGVIEQVMKVDQIQQVDFQAAVESGKIDLCLAEVDEAFLEQHKQQSFPGPRDIKVLYSPLHGVGEFNVCAALDAAGFEEVEVFAPHREPNGDFPNVPGHVSNPENARVFDAMIDRAKESGARVALATDPDCDRLGVAAPLTLDLQGEWATFTGNQIGVLLADYVLEQRQKQGTLSADHYVVKTLVTTGMVERIAESYGVRTIGDLLVGFKWIGEVMEREGADHFVFGCEESHGYLVGAYARDKDGAVASMLMAELAASVQAAGQSLHEKLDALSWQHGLHREDLINVMMEGSDGMRKMEDLLAGFRASPPQQLGGVAVQAMRDYQAQQTTTLADGSKAPLQGPHGNMLIFDLEDGRGTVAVRPSGTEPKIKFYLAGVVAPEQIANLEDSKRELSEFCDAIAGDLTGFAK